MTARAYIFTIVFLCVFLPWSYPSETASESLYKFVDEDGVLHLSNFVSDKRYRPLFPEKEVRKKVDGRTMEKIHKLIETASYLHAVDAALIKAVIKAESDFNPYAVSHAGAKGLMQLMPETADTLNVFDPFDPKENIFGGVRHLKKLLNSFDGDVTLTLAAYNAGRNNVLKYGGIPPFKQTEEYVEKVLRYFKGYRDASSENSS